MQAEIITIGDEILIGQIIDSNSAWIAQKLNGIGVHIKQISSVADNTEDIQVALKLASNRADIILITGGLGPTKDDVTKQTLCKYFNCQLRRDEQVLQHVTSIFERSQRPMLELNRRQADVLDNCEVLFNVLGTAPGMWVKTKKNHYIIMPGVPFEMQHIMETHVIPKLKTLEDRLPIWHHTMITGGIGESFLAEKIADIENSLPSHIHLAYLPKLGTVRLRLTAIGADEKKLKAETQHISEQLKDRIGIHFLANEDISIESLVSETLLRYKKTLSTAESCTGGNIARCITSLPGSSRIFEGSAVTYSNALKVKLVNVNPATLEQDRKSVV